MEGESQVAQGLVFQPNVVGFGGGREKTTIGRWLKKTQYTFEK